MAGTFDPYVPNVADWHQSALSGYKLGESMRQRNVLADAGGMAASGNLKGARGALYAGGNFDDAAKVDDRMNEATQRARTEDLAKAQRFNETLGNLAMAADTPEKWEKAITTAQSLGIDVGKYRDFGTRDVVLAQTGKTVHVLKMELGRRKVDISGERNEAIAARAAAPKPKALSDRSIEKLGEKGSQVENVTRYIDTFKDEAAGYGVGGDTAMWLGRNMPIFTGPKTENAAAWWNDYDRYKNALRNELFGSALTAPEAAAFEKADIGVNMSPALIRKNLARQKEAVTSALRKHTNALKKSGYDPEAVDAATGVEADQLAPAASGRSTNRKGAAIPRQAAEMLAQDPSPEAQREFDDIFGPGASQAVLGR